MSKKDVGLLAYLGYKAVKNEPDRVGEEIGKCILGWIGLMIIGLITYAVMTLILSPPSFITDNLTLIGILIFVGIIGIIIFCIFNIGTGSTNNPNKFKYDKKMSEEIKKTYSETMPCPNCGRWINKKAIRCKYCKTILKEY